MPEKGEEKVFHPCPGDVSHQAWMNIVLSGEEEIYQKLVRCQLTQWELHNLIVLLWHDIKKHDDPNSHTVGVHRALMEKLDRLWALSLWEDGSRRWQFR